MKYLIKTMVLAIYGPEPIYYFFEANEEEAFDAMENLRVWYQENKDKFYESQVDEKTSTKLKNNMCGYDVDDMWSSYLDSIQKDAPTFLDLDLSPDSFEDVCQGVVCTLETHMKAYSINFILRNSGE